MLEHEIGFENELSSDNKPQATLHGIFCRRVCCSVVFRLASQSQRKIIRGVIDECNEQILYFKANRGA
jgi:hypothetical protein